jgi:branched-subunit amino acid ABC-type transport system permease component
MSSTTILIDILVQAAVMIILCLGFTFTYMMEKFPNFGHTAIATVGTLIAFALVRIWGYNPYSTWLVSTVACGLLAVGLYIFVVRPIKTNGANIITLTFVFFAIAMVVGSIVNVFSYWFLYNQGYPAEGFWLASFDFNWQGYPGVFVVTLPLCAVLVIAFYLFFTKVRFGIAIRAAAENEQLAAILGVNTSIIHIFSWFLTGALAGLAGAIIPLWQYTGLGYTDTYLILVMAGSVLGGLQSIAGAVIGGFLVTIIEKGLTILLIEYYGIWVADWGALIPSIFIVAVIMIEPEGLMGVLDHPQHPIRTLRRGLLHLRRLFSRSIHSA